MGYAILEVKNMKDEIKGQGFKDMSIGESRKNDRVKFSMINIVMGMSGIMVIVFICNLEGMNLNI